MSRTVDGSAEPLEVVLVGAGLPGRSVGWLHLSQLLDMPSVRLTHVVEPWWLGEAADRAGRVELCRAIEGIRAAHPYVRFLRSLDELPPNATGRARLAVLATRAADTPAAFRAAVARGVTHVYLEKPGAADAGKLGGCGSSPRPPESRWWWATRRRSRATWSRLSP